MAFVDREIVCRDCSSAFVFSAGQQQFFVDRGLQDPKRCPQCRQTRRRERDGEQGERTFKWGS